MSPSILVHSTHVRCLAIVSALVLWCGCDSGGGATVPPEPPDPEPPPPAATLPISAVLQETPQWCWAAVGEMVLEHYGYPNVNPVGDFQCGLVAATFEGACIFNCLICQNLSIGTATNLQYALQSYAAKACNYVNLCGYPPLQSAVSFSSLPQVLIAQEIAAGSPIIAGISPSGYSYPNVSQHACLIVGYDFEGGSDDLIVHDPFPFHLSYFGGAQDPYLAVGGQMLGVGRYRISRTSFEFGLNWGNSIHAFHN